jgi:hypothetical protein
MIASESHLPGTAEPFPAGGWKWPAARKNHVEAFCLARLARHNPAAAIGGQRCPSGRVQTNRTQEMT